MEQFTEGVLLCFYDKQVIAVFMMGSADHFLMAVCISQPIEGIYFVLCLVIRETKSTDKHFDQQTVL